MKKVALTIIASALLAACSSTPAPVKTEPTPAPTQAPAATGDVKTVDTTATTGSKLDPRLSDPNNILSQRRVYFDFDSYEVKDTYNDVIKAHAKFLNENKDYKIIIQGNTDDRGTAEYNLALGQKRAEAVAKMMRALGVSDAQIETVSFGKERPLENANTEEAWSRNRRADIVYVGEQAQ